MTYSTKLLKRFHQLNKTFLSGDESFFCSLPVFISLSSLTVLISQISVATLKRANQILQDHKQIFR